MVLTGKRGEDFTVNGQRLKLYMADREIGEEASVPLSEPIPA